MIMNWSKKSKEKETKSETISNMTKDLENKYGKGNVKVTLKKNAQYIVEIKGIDL